MSGKLARNVYVNSHWYGPAYPDAGDPPAGAVTNPLAYEGGKVPEGDDRGSKPMDVEHTAHDAEGVIQEGAATTGTKRQTGGGSRGGKQR